MNSRARITGLGLLAGVVVVAMILASWNSGVAATPGQSGSSGQSNYHDPAINHALKSLRAAHYELKEAKHDFGGHREVAIHAVDEAIKQLDICFHSKHNGAGNGNNSSQSRNRNQLSAGS